jgi:hypothetical protein
LRRIGHAAAFQKPYGNGMNSHVVIVHSRPERGMNWHSGQMADEIDRVRAKSALAVIKQHPGMVLFLASPGIVALGAVWFLVGPGWAAILLIALVLAGGAALLRKR